MVLDMLAFSGLVRRRSTGAQSQNRLWWSHWNALLLPWEHKEQRTVRRCGKQWVTVRSVQL